MRIAIAFLSLMIVAMFAVTPSHAAQNEKGNTMIKFETTLGDFVVELDEVKAPITCANFINYVKTGFYDGTIFHRVMDGFMVQGGGFTTAMAQKDTGATIQNEADNGLSNVTYSIAMARTNDPHSATAQFFVNVNNNTFLDHKAPTASGWGYAVFGRVVEGTEVIDAMKGVQTGNYGFHQNVPTTPIVINKASIVE
ncbi:MAG: peptidylprolyl isomerase [Pseudomonadota bacterium]